MPAKAQALKEDEDGRDAKQAGEKDKTQETPAPFLIEEVPTPAATLDQSRQTTCRALGDYGKCGWGPAGVSDPRTQTDRTSSDLTKLAPSQWQQLPGQLPAPPPTLVPPGRD